MTGRSYPDGTVAVDVAELPSSAPGIPAGAAGEPVSALWATYAVAVAAAACDRLTADAYGLVAPHPARGPAGDQLKAEHADVMDPVVLAQAVAMLHAANRAWWRLDVDEVRFKLAPLPGRSRDRAAPGHVPRVDVPEAVGVGAVVAAWRL